MKQNSIYLIGICALLFSACAKEELPVTNEIRENETKEVTFFLTFADALQSGTEYEPMTKAKNEDVALVNNTYHYYVTNYTLDATNIETYGTALFDKTKGADEVITLTKDTPLDPLTIVLPATNNIYGVYDLFIYTGGNKRFEWAGDFKTWQAVNFEDAVLLYKEQLIHTGSSEYRSDSFSGEIFAANIFGFDLNKTTDLPAENSNPLTLEFSRFNIKFRVLLKDSETAGGKRFSDYTDGDIFIYMELEAADVNHPVSSGLSFYDGHPYIGKTKETLRYCTSVSQSYQATSKESEDKFYISTPGDQLYAPFLPPMSRMDWWYKRYMEFWIYKVKRVVCESVNSAGETVRFTYEGGDERFGMSGNYNAFAFELTDDEIEPGNYRLAPIISGGKDPVWDCYGTFEFQDLFSPDFEESFLD